MKDNYIYNNENLEQKLSNDCFFLVRIKYRQNATYQGEITLVNGENKKIFFRSLLELITLLEEALNINQLPSNYEFRSWKKDKDLLKKNI